MLDVSLLTEHCCTVNTCAIVEIQESLTQELTSVECSYSNGRSSIYRGSVLTHVLNLHVYLHVYMVPLPHHLVSLLSAAY